MADKKPLYIENGRIQEFGSGDTISATIAPGSGGGGGGGGGPSWSNGVGERRFLVEAAATGGSTGIPANTLSSVSVSNFYWSTGATTKVLTYTFPSANRMTGIGFVQHTGTANGIWTLAGSTDGIAWTDIITDYVLGGTPYGPIFPPPAGLFLYVREFSNTVQYKYYRLTLNAGQSTSNNPYIQQALFKCEAIQ